MPAPGSALPAPARTLAERVARRGAIAGAVLVTATSLVGSGFSPLALPFVAWSLVPYGVLAPAGQWMRDPWTLGGAAAVALAAETGIRAAVFVFPRGSTAAIALVFSPALIGLACLPAGAVAGHLLGRLHRTGGLVVRAGVWMVAAAGLGLIVLGFARPDLFPTAVIARRERLARIGEPRVVIGADAFEATAISNAAGWHVVGELDGRPGDDIAIVDHRGADLVDSETLQVVRRVDFTGQPGRLWSWFSRLVRIGDHLAVAQTGGGYQETELRGLDGALLWCYRPDPQLATSAMLAADLDADGEVEFYASSTTAVARLNPAGTEVWRQAAAMAHLVAVAPQTPASPAWVLAYEYGRKLVIWDDRGRLLVDRSLRDEQVLGIADWPSERSVILGGSTLRTMRLDGATTFDMELSDMTLSDAAAVRFSPDGAPVLAVVSAAPSDVERWRVQLVTADHRVVYEEVLARSVRLLKATRADGRDRLLLSGEGLRTLLPR